ncbi:MAG: glutaredoxin family protein [Chloroflexota bacterium]
MKEFLSQKGVQYTERDVLKDEQAMVELERLGYLTTPVIVIDGQVVIGFNEARLNELLR